MQMKKLLTLFATALMLLCAQNANADITLTALSGSNWNHSSESPRALFDGKQNTKWGNTLGENSTSWVVFKSSSPILPTKYKLRIANDTQSFPGRNWKSWKVYGGNFLTDADATQGASGWVEIDSKQNQTLSTTSFDEVELTLSSPGSNHYFYYFKIEVSALMTTGQYGQMDEFWFSAYTEGDFVYTLHSASNPNGNEGARRLFDGHGNTKWGRSTSPENPSWVIFKTSKAINATSYTLTEANDTPGSPDRNWKKWKIYGANFYSEKVVAKDDEAWVLLDEKNITNNDDFPISSSNNTYKETSFNMSEGNTGSYEYFKIVVEDLRTSGQYGQMGDFRFNAPTLQAEGDTYATKVALAKAVTFDPQTLGTSYPLYTEFLDLTTGSTLNTYLANAAGNYTSLKGKLDEVYELQRVMTAYLGGRDFSGIIGSDGCWNDGHYDNLVDGNNNTKWGGNFPSNQGMWMIFRAKESIKPYFYKLLTAWDAQNWAGRNWKDWTIKGGNFATMDAAQREASGWTVIDSRTGVGQDLLPAKNGHLAPFGVNGTFSDEFDYFLVEVTKAYNDGTQIQMNELILGTEEEFNATKTAYLNELNAYVVPDAATNEQRTAYAAAITDVQNATPENILERYNAAKAVQSEIFQSLKDGNGFYQITSPVDLELFSDLVNAGKENGEPAAKGKLTADIDLTDFSLTIIGGNSDFKGELDGQGHTISHLTDYNAAGWRSGLIGQANEATIHDIVFEDAEIYGRNSMSVAVGEATNSTIKNILVRNCVAKTISGGDRLGAIAGQIKGSTCTIQNCAVLNSTLEGHNYVGAITGNAIDGATVKNCYSDSDVKAQGSYAGGIAGAAQTATIEKNLFTGTLTSIYDRASGLVGLFNVQEDYNYTLALQKNMIAATTVTAPYTNSLMYVPSLPTSQTTDVSYLGNYLLKSTVYSDGEKILTEENDLNGKQISWIEATTKDFYATTLGWDFTNDWKFTCGGKYPLLKIMPDEALPTQTLNVSAAGYATVVADYDFDFTDAAFEAYAVTISASGQYASLEAVTSAQHGEALLLKKENGGSFTQTATADAKTATAGNQLKASDGTVTGGTGIYALAKKNDVVGFYPVAASVTIPAGKAYLEVETDAGGDVKAFYGFEEDATGIENLNVNDNLNESIYNVAGQRLNKVQKGINIVNGKKILK